MSRNNGADWLLKQESNIAFQCVQELLLGERNTSEYFDWQLVAECAASSAFPGQKNALGPNFDWAQVALLAYQHLIQEEKKSSRLLDKPVLKKNIFTSYLLKLMQVQVKSILEFGTLAGDPLRDVHQLIHSFFEDIPFSPDNLQKALKEQRTYSFEKRMELHWLLQKLQTLQPLAKRHLLPPNEQLTRWFSVWDQIAGS